MPATITVTENWSERRYQRAEYAQRGWIVTGVADEVAAIKAVGDRYDNAVYKGARFVIDSRLFGEEPRVELIGPTTYHVITVYTKNSDSVDPEPDNPLDKEIQWEWDEGTESVTVDTDAYGVPLLNANARPFDRDATDTVDRLFVTATRFESSYDVRKNIAYRSRINADRVLIPMAGSVDPGEMKLLSYRPLQQYSRSTPYIEVAYRFELGPPFATDPESDGLFDTFKHRILAQSYEGWWDDSGTKRIGALCNSKGGLLHAPAPLNRNGLPLDSSIMVLPGDNRSPVAATTPPTAVSSQYKEVLLPSGTTFMKYTRKKSIAFSGLNLF